VQRTGGTVAARGGGAGGSVGGAAGAVGALRAHRAHPGGRPPAGGQGNHTIIHSPCKPYKDSCKKHKIRGTSPLEFDWYIHGRVQARKNNELDPRMWIINHPRTAQQRPASVPGAVEAGEGGTRRLVRRAAGTVVPRRALRARRRHGPAAAEVARAALARRRGGAAPRAVGPHGAGHAWPNAPLEWSEWSKWSGARSAFKRAAKAPVHMVKRGIQMPDARRRSNEGHKKGCRWSKWSY
jgi:hypothetical protein